jgi:hypothetical protein
MLAKKTWVIISGTLTNDEDRRNGTGKHHREFKCRNG